MRTLIVSSGWHTNASIMPAAPPAIKFVDADAGCFFVLFAGIVALNASIP
jgi:hypothetical protein